MRKLVLILFFISGLIICPTAIATTRYVPGQYPTIQAAINAASNGDVIVAADGIYTGTGNRDIDFLGKAITVQSQNGPENCIIDCQGSSTELHRGFIFQNGEDEDSVLEGLKIINGYHWSSSGGIYNKGASPTISKCVFVNNRGGIYNNGSNSNPIVTNCIFIDNYGDGAIEDLDTWSYSYTIVKNCLFTGNSGAGIVGSYARFNITNCTFVSNGWGFAGHDSLITNCIFWGNSSGQVEDWFGNIIKYSNIQGGLLGEGNIDDDPLFRDPGVGDYHLMPGSPCISAGDPTGDYAGQTDIDGQPRVLEGRVDMGADEFALGPSSSPPSDDVHLGEQESHSGSTADPVNTATGNFTNKETDLSVTSRVVSLDFSRFYNSQDSRSSPLGPGWTHSYNIRLVEDSNLVSVRWGDGRTDYWNPNGQGGYEPNTPGLYNLLVKDSSDWTVTKKNLDVYTFDANGLLQSIKDKNGNTITLSYNLADANLVTSISDPVGRTLTLTYDSNGFLESVADFNSRSVQFDYTGNHLTQVTDVLGNTIDYIYDSNGYLTIINDQRDVNVITNVYDANGRVIQQTDGNGNTTTFAYDTPEPNQTSITDPNGNTTVHMHFTEYKLLRAIKNPLGHIIAYYYDENMNRTAITNRNGKTTLFNYDSRGNVIAKTDPNDVADPYDGGVTVVDYNDVNFPDLPTKKTDALGNVTQWQYDLNGNVIKQINPDGNEIDWTYNSFGQKQTETDENGNTTTHIYDGNGLLTEVIDPNGNHTWYGYDALWRLTRVTDGRGSYAGDPNHTTITTYDDADRVTSITGPITSESYQYDEVGNRTGVTNGRGYTTVYQYDNNNNLTRIERVVPGDSNQVTQHAYDELNRKISTTDPNGNITTYEYDAAGRLLKQTDAEGNQASYTYDAHGNILSITDGSDANTFYEYDSLNRRIHQYEDLGNHWYWQYDKLGRVTKHTDAIGHITRYEYDALGRLTSVIDDANNVTEYEYDAVGNLIEIVDANGKFIDSRHYDKANRLIRKEDGLGHAYEYSYDGADNLISRKDAGNQVTTYVYDNENRLVEVHYPDSNQVTYSYDNNGNLVNMTDPTGTTTYTYDALDRLTDSNDSFGKQVQYGYDITGNRTSITYPADSNNPARIVTYVYDKANRLDKIIDWAGRTWDYTVDGAGRITDVNYPSGVKELRTYDDAGRLSSLLYKDSNDVNLITYSYTRDGQGNPLTISETGTLEPTINLPLKVDYSYDNDNRLISTTVPATYGYDNNGNMTSRVRNGVTTTFTYDFENCLTSQTTGPNTVQHVYDGRGNRIARIENGVETRYILDRGRNMSHILCETDDSNEIVAYYIHGPQILARIEPVGSERYYHTNHIGSVVALTDANETVTDRYAYTPFGVPTGREGGVPNPFTYIGGLGVMAEADGLCFMRARFYELGTGKFLSKDPIAGWPISPITLHRYQYARGNPTVLVDPEGKVAPLIILAVVAIIGGSAAGGAAIETFAVQDGDPLAGAVGGAVSGVGLVISAFTGNPLFGSFGTIAGAAVTSAMKGGECPCRVTRPPPDAGELQKLSKLIESYVERGMSDSPVLQKAVEAWLRGDPIELPSDDVLSDVNPKKLHDDIIGKP